MFEQDYLMRLLLQFFQAMTRSLEVKKDYDDPLGAADMLEAAIGNATDMDGAALLSLSPDSIAQIMRATDVDPNVTQFVARSMLLESVYLSEAGQDDLAALRAEQARAISAEYAFDLPPDPSDFESITEGLEKAAEQGGFFPEETDEYAALMGVAGMLNPNASADTVDAPGATDDVPYWMQYGSVLDDEPPAPTGFGSFIDNE